MKALVIMLMLSLVGCQSKEEKCYAETAPGTTMGKLYDDIERLCVHNGGKDCILETARLSSEYHSKCMKR